LTGAPTGSATHSPDAARKSGPALEAMYRFVVWLIPTLDKLPRSQRFLLGDRVQATALDVLERLIEATYSKARERSLGEANLGIEKLRFLFGICVDLRYLDPPRVSVTGLPRFHDIASIGIGEDFLEAMLRSLQAHRASR
jgi:hypothetical protein